MSIKDSSKEDTSILILIKRKKNRVLLRFYELHPNSTIALTQEIAKSNELALSEKGYIIEDMADRLRDLNDIIKWILKDFINITGYKNITKCPCHIIEV